MTAVWVHLLKELTVLHVSCADCSKTAFQLLSSVFTYISKSPNKALWEQSTHSATHTAFRTVIPISPLDSYTVMICQVSRIIRMIPQTDHFRLQDMSLYQHAILTSTVLLITSCLFIWHLQYDLQSR